MQLDPGMLGVILAVGAQFVATVRGWTRIEEQLKVLNIRVLKLEGTMEDGGYARCKLHEAGARIIEARMLKLEEAIERLREHHERINCN